MSNHLSTLTRLQATARLPLSRITFYVVIFGPFVCFLDRHRVVAWRMDCFGALQVWVVCEVRRVKNFRPRR